jgi:hypothetical protein
MHKRRTGGSTDAMLGVCRLIQIKTGVAVVIFSFVEIQVKVAVVVIFC